MTEPVVLLSEVTRTLSKRLTARLAVGVARLLVAAPPHPVCDEAAGRRTFTRRWLRDGLSCRSAFVVRVEAACSARWRQSCSAECMVPGQHGALVFGPLHFVRTPGLRLMDYRLAKFSALATTLLL